MIGLQRHWTAFRDEFRRNARLRAGVVVIACILLAWGALFLNDLKSAHLAAYGEEFARLQKVRALSGQSVWLARAADAKRLDDALSAEIPDAKTAGLAQAAFQTQLGAIAQKYGGALKVQVSPATREPGAADVWRVPASIDGDISVALAEQFIAELETRQNLITIERLSIVNRDKTRLSATVQAYYRPPTAEVSNAP